MLRVSQESRDNLIALCVFALSPLVSTTLVYSLFSLPKVCVLWAGLLLRNRTATTPLDRVLLAGLAALVLPILVAPDQMKAVIGRDNDYSYGLMTIILYMLYFKWGATVKDPKRFFPLIGAAAVLVAVIAILERYGVFVIRTLILPEGRAVSTIGSPVMLGTYLAACLPFTAPWAWGVMTLGMLASGSRGAFLAAAAGVVFVKVSRKHALIIGCLAVIAACAVISLKELSLSDRNRIAAWVHSTRLAVRYPLTGVGLNNFWMPVKKGLRHENSHNDLFQAASTTGIPGLLVYIWLWVVIFRRVPTATAFAVFVAAKLNPISIEIGAILAAVTGLSLPRRKTTPVPFPIAVLPFVLFSYLLIADYYFKHRSYARAAAMVPWNVKYLIKAAARN